MSVEVLRKGEKPEDRIFGATCTNCRSQLRFKQGDASYHSDQRDGDYVSIKCPVCNAAVNVDANSYQKPTGLHSVCY